MPPHRFFERGAPFLAACGLAVAVGLACGGPGSSPLEGVRTLQQAGSFDESVEPLRQILEAHPEEAEASYRLGVALLRSGRPDEAVDPLRQAARSERAEYARPAGALLAATLFRMARFPEAIEAASEALERNADNQAALLTRANASLASGAFEGSLQDAERLSSLNPDNLAAYSLRVAALTGLERWDEASAVLERSHEIAQTRESPHVARICIMQGKLHGLQGDPTRARSRIQACLETYPGAETLASAVAAFDALGLPADVLAVLRSGHAEHPENAMVMTALAARLRAAGERAEADALLLEGARATGDPEIWLQLARGRREGLDPASAREALEEALALDPPRGELIRLELADTLIDLGELTEAEAQASALENSMHRKLIQGRVQLERGDPQGALELLEPTARQGPVYERSRIYAAWAHCELGNTEAATLELQEAMRFRPMRGDAALQLAKLHLAEGDLSSALAVALRYSREHGFTSPEAHLISARSAIGMGRLIMAQRLLDDLSGRPGMHGLGVAERARLELAMRGPEAAIAWTQNQDLDPSNRHDAPALLEWAEIELRAGRAQAVRERAVGLAAAHPDAAHLHALLGHVHMRTGEPDEAARDFDRALAIDAADPLALAGRAQLASLSGDHAAATRLFDRAQRADPVQRRHGYAAVQAQLAAGNPDEAERRLRLLVHRDPEIVEAANDLAWLLAERGERLDFALVLARRARLLQRPEALDTLGWVYLRRQELEPAGDSFREALDLDPDYATARYHLGLVLSLQGDREGALEALRTALAVGTFPEAQQARSEIARLEGE